jgi:hypothetical protein
MKSLILMVVMGAFIAVSTGAMAGSDRISEAINIAQKAAVADAKKVDAQLKAIADDAAKLLEDKGKAKSKKKAK